MAENNLKIYFAGSVRGGRENVFIYKQIIKLLGKYGSVLTEHLGNEKILEQGEGKPDEVIFKRDIQWLQEADVVVADITIPSIGVGYEISNGENLGKRIICLYNENATKKISAMINGNKNLNVKTYKNIYEVEKILEEFFNKGN